MIASLQDETVHFGYIEESDDEFLKLFSHRWDFLYAQHPEPGAKPNWKTASVFPLGDRQIQQGEYLYGVRFGSQTNYLMIDLDPTSLYHPHRDPFAVTRLTSALEPIGLVACVCVQSSYRGGVHLYFPFEGAQPSWAIALVVQTLLENAGFVVRAGQLEIFPNARTFTEGTLSLYNGHRLPLQAGSYILNADWAPIYSTQASFVSYWKFAQCKNTLNLQTIERVRKQAQYKQFRTSVKAQKFLSDLNTEIALGWTGPGQTNRILGKIACRERIFHHILHGGQPLVGEALEDAIVQIARSLPGYEEFCGHQYELEERAREYARSAEKRYYPLGSKRSLHKEVEAHHIVELTWNQRQAQAARERIRKAIADMMDRGTFPPQVTARFNALKSYGIGSDTLGKNRDLWDPRVLESTPQKEFLPTEPQIVPSEPTEPLQDKEFPPINTNKFVGLAGLDAPPEQSEASPAFNVGGSRGFSTDVSQSVSATGSCEGAKRIAAILAQIRMDSLTAKLAKCDSPPPDENYFLSRGQENSS